jgi:hypothetical protein
MMVTLFGPALHPKKALCSHLEALAGVGKWAWVGEWWWQWLWWLRCGGGGGSVDTGGRYGELAAMQLHALSCTAMITVSRVV